MNVRRVAFAMVLAWGLLPRPANAAPLRPALELVEEIVRQAGRYSDDAARILAREADDAVELLARHSDDAIARLLRSSEREEVEQLLDRRLNRLLRPTGAISDTFRHLPLAQRHLVLELAEAGQQLAVRHPQGASRLLTQLGSGGLAQARTYGDAVFDGALWLTSEDTLAKLGAAPLTPKQASAIQRLLHLNGPLQSLGNQDVVVPLWRSALRRTRGGAAAFWRKYVAPHPGKWLAGGAIATYLVAPESFHDAAGRLTDYGARELARLGVSSAVGTGTGLLDGVAIAIKGHWSRSPARTLASLGAICVLLSLSIPRFRGWVWRRFAARRRPPVAAARAKRGVTIPPSDIK